MIAKPVTCESTNIEDILSNILDESDISFDCCTEIVEGYSCEDLSHSVSMNFVDPITDKRYWLHIFSEADSKALISFYYNDVYRQISSPEIVLIGILNGRYFYAIEEHIAAISLQKWLESSYDSYISGLLILKQLTCNLQVLHSYKFVHGDISAKNILIDVENDNKVWLIDFETVHQSGQVPRSFRITPKYAGTESGKEGVITDKTDIQSLGYIIKEFYEKKRDAMPNWLQAKMLSISSYCTDNIRPSIDIVVEKIQKLLNICCLESIFLSAASEYSKVYQCGNTKEDDVKCAEYKKATGTEGDIFFACEERSKGFTQSTYLLLGDKEILREDYSPLSLKPNSEIIPTRKIYLDLLVYAWEYDEHRIAFIARHKSRNYKSCSGYNIYRFNPVGVDNTTLVNTLNSIVQYRQSTVDIVSLPDYYGQVLDEISKLELKDHKTEKICKKIKEILLQQIG